MNLSFNWRLITEISGGVLFVALLAWFFFFRSTPELAPAQTAEQQTFSQIDVQSQTAPATGENSSDGNLLSPTSQQKIFKISDGPVAGAAFTQEARPTTTVARFVMQQNGHVLDLPLDSPGAISRSVSNTTIPGVARVTWALRRDAGRQVASVALLQYLNENTVKTLSLAFPAATSTSGASAPVRIQFLPDNITSLAASPDGTRIAYLLTAPGGSDGYVAQADGSNRAKLFSLPLSQILLGWPAANAILAVSKAATGVPGIAFSINPASGTIAPNLYAPGLTATADPSFAYVVYQNASAAGRTSYVHDVKTNLDRSLSFDPVPEKCVWSRARTSVMYCALPLSYTAPEYLDLWRQGTASAADSIVAYDLMSGKSSIVATPGSQDGGAASDILEMALSADEKYLLFVVKGERSLWGVRLY